MLGVFFDHISDLKSGNASRKKLMPERKSLRSGISPPCTTTLGLKADEQSTDNRKLLLSQKETARLYMALRKLPVPKDLLLYSRDEFEKLKSVVHRLVNRVAREGKVLHVRA